MDRVKGYVYKAEDGEWVPKGEGTVHLTGKQTWWGSIVEAKANIAVGFCIAYVANLVVLPLFGVTGNDPVKNLGITSVYTVISVIRQLVVRRFFNNLKWGHHK